MFYLTKKTDYGLNFLISLAKNTSQTPLRLSEVASKNGLPKTYLAKLAANLVKAQIIKSREGIKGGYILAKKPAEISLNEVMKALETERNANLNSCKNCSCQFCAKRDVVTPLEEEIGKTLKRKTLADFLDKGLRLTRAFPEPEVLEQEEVWPGGR